MAQRYARRILDHLANTRYTPRTAHELADELGVAEDDREDFHKALDQLLEDKQVILGTSETVALPPPGREVAGTFRKHERGFGFIIPDELLEHGDLFVPPGQTGDALTGDRVRAKVKKEKGRAGGGRSPYTGQIVEILKRADRHYAGTLEKKGSEYFVNPDGKALHQRVLIRDPETKNAKPGDKVVVDLVQYPEGDDPAEGVIIEVLGEAGEPDVETRAIIHAFGLREKFSESVHDDARQAAHSFDDESIPEHREDLTDVLTLTIDPPDAKDFDDAITLRRLDGDDHAPDHAAWELGIHIADVAHFIQPGTEIETEAYERGNSTYLPRKVIPMLPELLSNGVCSLQPGVHRFAKSCFIQYDEDGKVLRERFSRSVIRSDKRLTYLEAQALIDGDIREARKHTKEEAKYPRPMIHQLQLMNELAKTIRRRRFDDGMIVLGLPEVELIYDDSGRVVDAEPEDDAFTHTIIEMFMVEANEAAARAFQRLDIPMIRRVHPDPDAFDIGELRGFARVAGFNVPKNPSRQELQQLLDSVRGKPAQHAVHLAVLRTLSKAEYAPTEVGHFALASEHYTHFTSPIRRYPDLIVHRGLEALIDAITKVQPDAELPWASALNKADRKKVATQLRDDDRLPSEDRLVTLGQHCSQTERNSESAERELRSYLVLELLSTKLGEEYDGVVTGVTGSGVFVQVSRYLIDGFVPSADLPGASDERWSLNRNTGALVAQRSGRSIQVGDRFAVRIADVDLGKRQMELVVVDDRSKKSGKKSRGDDDQSNDGEGGGDPDRGSGKKKKGKRSGKSRGHKSGGGDRGKSGGKTEAKAQGNDSDQSEGGKGKKKSRSRSRGGRGRSRGGRGRGKSGGSGGNGGGDNSGGGGGGD